MKSLALTGIFCIFSICSYAQPTVIFVNKNATGLNNGSSWTNAYTNLNSALLTASSNDQIWVASAVYYPATDNDRIKSFSVIQNVGIYGGFSGTETAMTQRNVQANATVLSGDIGTTGDSTDNSHQIFTIVNQTGTVIIDGFTIRHAQSPSTLGGAVHINNCNDVRFRECTFQSNYSAQAGGSAIFLRRLSKISIDRCSFLGNKCNLGGGAVFSRDTCEITIDSSYFDNNYSPGNGGTITSNLSKYRITNTDFNYSNGMTYFSETAIYAWNSNYYDTAFYFKNCSLSGITSGGNSMIYFNNVKNAIFENCDLSNNTFTTSSSAILYFHGEIIKFKNCSIHNNNGTGSYMLNTQSSLIKEVSFDSVTVKGNTGFSYTLYVSAKKFISAKNIFSSNTATAGIIYLGSLDTASITNSVFSNNNTSGQSVIFSSAKIITVLDSQFENNTSSYSSFFFNSVINLICNNNKFSNNLANNLGGAMGFSSNTATSVMNNCEFTNNRSNYGGAIHMTGTGKITLLNILFKDNKATNGGAIFHTNILEILFCTFLNNKSPFGVAPIGKGGAIHTASAGKLILFKTKFENNQATEGGAIYSLDSLLAERCYLVGNKTAGSGQYGSTIHTQKYCKLVNTKLYNNSCDSNGTIFNKGRLDLYNNTFNANKYGAVVNQSGGSFSPANYFVNTIFWENNVRPDTFNIIDRGTIPVKDYQHCISNEYLGGNNFFEDPLLDLELRISSLSPAIDAGINYTGMPLVDYDSTDRIKLTAIDIGAYEISHDSRLNNYVTGYTYIDVNNNCVLDTVNGDILLPGIPITVKPQYQYASSDTSGQYVVRLLPGTYTITAPLTPGISGNYTLGCPATKEYNVNFSTYGDTISGFDFGYQKIPVENCKTDLGISVAYGIHRPCLLSQVNFIYITAANNSILPASNVTIEAIVPTDLFIKECPYPYTRDGDTVKISLGILKPMSSVFFAIKDSVECTASIPFGGSGCFKFTIKEGTNCIPPVWDKSDLLISVFSSGCNISPVRTNLSIINSGTGDMSDSTEYRVFENYRLVRKGKIKLKSQESLFIIFPHDPGNPGVTRLVEVNETSYHPEDKAEHAMVYACTPLLSYPFYQYTPPSIFSSYTTHSIPRTGRREVEECIPFTGSYDPNSIEVDPDGFPTDSYIAPDQEMTYKINFQNTGTDTAFTVVLVHTLDPGLDVNTLIMGASSHPYTWTLSGETNPVLTIRFDNIKLPDSSKSYLESMGYVSFTIQQVAGLVDYTRINAQAGIYFDLNEAVITNNAYVTIKRAYDTDFTLGNNITLNYNTNTPTSTINVSEEKGFQVILYPNPLANEGVISIDPEVSGKKKLAFYNMNGQLIMENSFEGNYFTFQTKNFQPGVYYYKISVEDTVVKVGKCLVGR